MPLIAAGDNQAVANLYTSVLAPCNRATRQGELRLCFIIAIGESLEISGAAQRAFLHPSIGWLLARMFSTWRRLRFGSTVCNIR